MPSWKLSYLNFHDLYHPFKTTPFLTLPPTLICLCPLVLSPQSTDKTVNLCGLLISSSPYPQSAPLTEAESQMGHYAILDVFTQCAGYSSMSVTSDFPDLNFICLFMIPSVIVIKLICFDFHIHSFRISFCLLDLFLPLIN